MAMRGELTYADVEQARGTLYAQMYAAARKMVMDCKVATFELLVARTKDGGNDVQRLCVMTRYRRYGPRH
jgi:hypothetical protein